MKTYLARYYQKRHGCVIDNEIRIDAESAVDARAKFDTWYDENYGYMHAFGLKINLDRCPNYNPRMLHLK